MNHEPLGKRSCQLRAVILNADYESDGTYQGTKRSTWGFIRLQPCN
ncbi:MAG: hypothetical protein H0T42_24680 [Deltaproteobacteria bacterium]|nr:hypothetical protein [Deltaproteobacteria bacterium]